MLKRKIEDKIFDWIETGKNALLIDGARQVGKTYVIRYCLEKAGADYIELNLIENSDALRALSVSKTTEDLVVNISAITGRSPERNKTIFFIDEVQESKEIITMIKFWVDDGGFRFVLSGSLLGVEIKAIRSAPVGYVHELKMYPMDFEEFMDASEMTDIVKEHLKQCFNERKPVGAAVHDKMMKLYFMGGGAKIVRAVGTYDEDRTFFDHDICSTAKGYEYFCYMKLRHNN